MRKGANVVRQICRTAIIVGAYLLNPCPAFGDGPVPPDYVETCTVTKREMPGTDCETCYVGAGGNDGACDPQYEATDYDFVCKTVGSTAWSEVWCDGPTREPVYSGGGCSGSAHPGVGAGVGITLLLLLAFGIETQKRRSSRRP